MVAEIRQKKVVLEDMAVEDMIRLTPAQNLCMELDVRQERTKMSSRCSLCYYRDMNAQIGPKTGFDCLDLETDGKEIEVWHDA